VIARRPVAFHTLDVFTDTAFGGNPLAVVLDAGALTGEQMQRIAGEFNLSETAFVSPPERGGTHRVRIFTPQDEMPFAGHPTIGTALLLSELDPAAGARLVFEEGVGPVPVEVRREGGAAFAELQAAQKVEVRPAPVEADELAALLSLAPADIAADAPGLTAASCGVPFLFVPLASAGALGRARVDVARWKAALSGTWSPHLFLYVFMDGRQGSLIRARMFAPSLGIPEDPATGGAVTALAAHFAELEPNRPARQWMVMQGVEMGRPSALRARIERRADGSTAVFVGGTAVRMSQGELWL